MCEFRLKLSSLVLSKFRLEFVKSFQKNEMQTLKTPRSLGNDGIFES